MFHGMETVLLKITLTETVLQMWECTADTVSNMFYPYVKPQDTEILRGVRWITVTNPNVSSRVAYRRQK